MAVKVAAKKEFTLPANDQVEVSTISCRSLPKMLRAFNQRNAVFKVLIRKISQQRGMDVFTKITRAEERSRRNRFIEHSVPLIRMVLVELTTKLRIDYMRELQYAIIVFFSLIV